MLRATDRKLTSWAPLVAALLFAVTPGHSQESPAEPSLGAAAKPTETLLRLLTFNIRIGYIPDGPRGWNFRRPAVLEVFRTYRPDIVGTQECTAVQANELLLELPDYRTVGRLRTGEELVGLMNVIFYRPEDLERLEDGVFWLSDDPARRGSVGWGNDHPRTARWCRFRRRADGRELLVIDTHLDHRSAESRDRSGPLIATRARDLSRGAAVIVMGDFNCGLDSASYAAMTSPPEQGGLGLVDSLRELHAAQEADNGTYHAFTGKGERRIDFVFASHALAPVRAEVVRLARDGQWPSDHFPVFAEVRVDR